MPTMFVYQTNPVGAELFSYVKTLNSFVPANKFALLLATRVKILYMTMLQEHVF